MMRIGMIPHKSQRPGGVNGIEIAWTSPGTYQFRKAEYVQYGYTDFKVATIGAGGGRAGVIAVNQGDVHLVAGAAGGGGGGIQIVSGKLANLDNVVSVVVGKAGTNGANKTGYDTANSGTPGGYSAFGSICKAAGGSGGTGGTVSMVVTWVNSGGTNIAKTTYKVENGYRGAGGKGGTISERVTGDGGGWSGNSLNGVGNGGAGGYPARRRKYPGGSHADTPSDAGFPGAGGVFAGEPQLAVSTYVSGGGGGASLPSGVGASYWNTNRSNYGRGGGGNGLVVILIK